ncbi:hypothetical protein [Nibricoccus sp. IMCC34717]|uniref:hypothetical protein n=1 Tax=Nibricoccus sp. IMCC34717 TaxID=3034021 RepID=UPI00384F89B9
MKSIRYKYIVLLALLLIGILVPFAFSKRNGKRLNENKTEDPGVAHSKSFATRETEITGEVGGKSATPTSGFTQDSMVANGIPVTAELHKPVGGIVGLQIETTENSQGTASMYAAHSPLRAKDLADPDSEINRKVLATMLEKSLTNPATPPPSN